MSDTQALISAVHHALQAGSEVAVHVFDTLDSTNSEAKRHADAETAPALYIARSQTAGRGRLGRSFHSPADTGLYMTLACTSDRPLTDLVPITALTAVAAVATIEHLTGRSPGIKWVNDLYLNRKKMAGILVEAVTLPAGRTRLIIGWGLNLTTQAFPDGLRASATALFSEAEASVVTNDLMGTLAGTVARRLLDWLSSDMDAAALPDGESCLAFYRRHLLFRGERVTCTRGSECFEGILRGVNEDYSLLVETDEGIRALGSGEISVRPTVL